MPELPDVEIFKRYIESTSLHKRITGVHILSRDMVKGASVSEIKKLLDGERFETTARHGKNLFIQTGGQSWIMLHFGMTGFVKYFKNEDERPAHVRLLIDFSNGFYLAYDCQRKFGMISLTESPERFATEKKLGLDALDPALDFEQFEKILSKTNSTIKTVLMNQNFLAGLGNVYSDEILYQAGIHPARKSGELDREEKKQIFFKMGHVLRKAIEAQADPARFPSSFLTPYRSAGKPCPKCEGSIEKKKIGGRTSYFCPRCQG